MQSVLQAAVLSEMREAVEQALATLSDRERAVLEMRYGLNGERSQYLSEVGNRVHLSKERIRQIQRRALAKLGDPLGSIQPLAQLMEDLDECLSEPQSPLPAQELRESLKQTENAAKKATRKNTMNNWMYYQRHCRKVRSARRSHEDWTVAEDKAYGRGCGPRAGGVKSRTALPVGPARNSSQKDEG